MPDHVLSDRELSDPVLSDPVLSDPALAIGRDPIRRCPGTTIGGSGASCRSSTLTR